MTKKACGLDDCNNPCCVCDENCPIIGCQATPVKWDDENKRVHIEIPYFVFDEGILKMLQHMCTVGTQIYNSRNGTKIEALPIESKDNYVS